MGTLDDRDTMLKVLGARLGEQWAENDLSNFWIFFNGELAATVGIVELVDGDYAYLLDVVDLDDDERTSGWVVMTLDGLLWELNDHDLPFVSAPGN